MFLISKFALGNEHLKFSAKHLKCPVSNIAAINKLFVAVSTNLHWMAAQSLLGVFDKSFGAMPTPMRVRPRASQPSAIRTVASRLFRQTKDGQTLAAQDAALHAAGCVKVYAEKASGAKTE